MGERVLSSPGCAAGCRHWNVKGSSCLLALAILSLLFPGMLLAQSPESAIGDNGAISAGGAVSFFNPDVYCPSSSPFNCGKGIPLMKGADGFFDVNLAERWGAEGEARWLRWDGHGGQTEDTYLLGGRYRIFVRRRFSIWGRFLLGGGWITSEYYPAPDTVKGSYFVYAPGATFNYRLTHHLSVRADYEAQRWPAFALPPTVSANGTVTDHNNGLLPNGFSVGMSWLIGHR